MTSDGFENDIIKLKKHRKFVGVRKVLDLSDENWIERDDVIRNMGVLARNQLTYDLLVGCRLVESTEFKAACIAPFRTRNFYVVPFHGHLGCSTSTLDGTRLEKCLYHLSGNKTPSLDESYVTLFTQHIMQIAVVERISCLQKVDGALKLKQLAKHHTKTYFETPTHQKHTNSKPFLFRFAPDLNMNQPSDF